MGYGTYFTAEIFINQEKYDNIHQVKSEIEYINANIQSIRERIMMYCASGCSGVNSMDCENNLLNPVDAMHSELSGLFEYYDEQQNRLYDLILLCEDWDEKEGKFKTAEVG